MAKYGFSLNKITSFQIQFLLNFNGNFSINIAVCKSSLDFSGIFSPRNNTYKVGINNVFEGLNLKVNYFEGTKTILTKNNSSNYSTNTTFNVFEFSTPNPPCHSLKEIDSLK